MSPRVAPTETPVTFALEIITYVGLAISIIGLLFTIITYLAVRYVHIWYQDLGRVNLQSVTPLPCLHITLVRVVCAFVDSCVATKVAICQLQEGVGLGQ